MGFFDEIGGALKDGIGSLTSGDSLKYVLPAALSFVSNMFGPDESDISGYQQAMLDQNANELAWAKQLAQMELAYKYAALAKGGGGGGGGGASLAAKLADARERDAMKQAAIQNEFGNLVSLLQTTKPDLSQRAGENMVQAAQNTGNMGIQGFGQLAALLQNPALAAGRR